MLFSGLSWWRSQSGDISGYQAILLSLCQGDDRAKKAWRLLQGESPCRVRAEPPTRIEPCVHGGVVVVTTTNKMDQA